MNGPLSDTQPRIEAILIEGFRAMSTEKKLRITAALSRTVRELALSDVRERYPADSEREHLLRAASRWIEPEEMKRVFGWDVDEHGF